MSQARVLAFAGSTRTSSFNKQLIAVAAGMAQQHGAEVTQLDLRDFPLPLYDGDVEESDGIPEAATPAAESRTET
jgi:chromate reductase